MKNIFTLLILSISINILAQQDNNYVLNQLDPYMLNPASSGLSDIGIISAGTRLQWLAVDGNPTSNYASINTPFKFGKKALGALNDFNTAKTNLFSSPLRTTGVMKHTAGLKMQHEQIGPFSKTMAHASYAFHVPLTKRTNISVGLGFGYSQIALNIDKIRVVDGSDETYQEILKSNQRRNLFDASFGIYIYGQKTQIGLSSSQLFQNSIENSKLTEESTLKRHWILNTSHNFKPDEALSAEPFMLIRKVDGAPLNLDLGMRIHIKQVYFIGISYRSGKTIGMQAGLNFAKMLNLSYGFDQYFGIAKSSLRATHELKLSYIFGKSKKVLD